MRPQNFELDRENLKITIHLHDGRTLIIGQDDVEITYFSKGKGGQNVNRNMNGVRLTYHIPEEFLLASKETRQLVVKCIDQRRMEQNLKTAFSRLAVKAGKYFYVKTDRKKTKVPKHSKEKRLKDKKYRSEVKRLRRY